MVDVVEDEVVDLAAPGEEQGLREAVLRYSREIAFAAAQVYAQAAEARGAWDARLESLVVDAVLRGEADDVACSRGPRRSAGARVRPASPWSPGRRPPGSSPASSTRCAGRAARLQVESLAAVQGRRLVGILGGVERPGCTAQRAGRATSATGPVVVGPDRARTCSPPAGRRGPPCPGCSPRRAWPDAPRPVPGRRPAARAGARRRRARPRAAGRPRSTGRWSSAGGSLLETASGLPRGRRRARGHRAGAVRPPQHGALPAAAGSPTVTGYDLTDPREAYIVRIALALGRLAEPTAPGWRRRHPATTRHVRSRHASCRNPPNRPPMLVPFGHAAGHGRAGRVEACSSSSAPDRAPRPPASSRPGSSCPASRDRLGWLSAVAGLDLVAHGTDLRRGDDQGHRRRPAADRRRRAGQRCSPCSSGRPRPAGSVGAIAGHSVGEITAAAAGRRADRRAGDGASSASAAGPWPRPARSTADRHERRRSAATPTRSPPPSSGTA